MGVNAVRTQSQAKRFRLIQSARPERITPTKSPAVLMIDRLGTGWGSFLDLKEAQRTEYAVSPPRTTKIWPEDVSAVTEKASK